jgi:hypothetical protein
MYRLYSARKKLIHAMSLDIDRPLIAQRLSGCAISATRNYLKLHISRTLKVLSCNTHAETRKLWKRSAGLPPLEAIPVDQFTTVRCCTSPARRDAHCTLLVSDIARRVVLASRLPARAAPTLNPHSARCLAGAQLPATSCLGAFRPPATSSCGGSRDPGVRKPAQQPT